MAQNSKVWPKDDTPFKIGFDPDLKKVFLTAIMAKAC